ncbi:MAG: amino acid ABC transporter ATP-binding protein [Thermoprotei archaeon]
MTDTILKTIDLWVNYGKIDVIKGINMHVNKGERLIILGPSGSGKSTLLKSLILLIKPKRGRIYFNNIEITDKSIDINKIRQKIGFVFQNYNLFPHLTVLRNITLPLEIVKKIPKERAEEKALGVLDLVNLRMKAHSYPAELSGGQQQRVAIARALAMDPELLLLDEPTSALDPEFVDEVLEVLERIAKEGISMIVVTHELDFAMDVADRILFIDNGIIIEEGKPEELINNPKNERTKSFLKRIHKK